MKLDHLVYAVPDLDRAVADFEARLGAAPSPGGRHQSVGTHNAILPLRGDAYVELMAPDPANPSPPFPLPFGLADDPGPRLVTWAAGTPEIEVAAQAARYAGFDPGTIVDFSRETPEGELLHWRLTLSTAGSEGGVMPFLIDWGGTPHPSRSGEAVCDIEGFRAEHPQPESARASLAALGCTLEVSRGPHPCLFANLVGPSGRIELLSSVA